MSFMVSEEVTVKEGGPRMIVTGYSAVWLSVVGMTIYGQAGSFHETGSLFVGEGVVLRKKFERVSVRPRPDHPALVCQCLQ